MLYLKRISKYGLLSWSVSLLLLHSLVPHQHHSSPLLEPVITNCIATGDGILGFLGKVFHQDLGGEHLEHFKHQNKVVFDSYLLPTLSLISAEALKTVPSQETRFETPYIQYLTTRTFTGPDTLRGPPGA